MATYNLIYTIIIENDNNRIIFGNDTIEGKQHNKIVNVEINKNINTFTNTCVIRLPRKLRVGNELLFNDVGSLFIGKGDNTTVSLGYTRNGQILNNSNQFEGYISEIKVINDKYVDIHLEDYMYWVKKTEMNFSQQSITLQEVAEKIITETNKIIPENVFDVDFRSDVDLTIKNLVVDKLTGVELLQYLYKNYLLKSYFINNTLVIGINFEEQKIDSELNSTRNNFNFSIINSKILNDNNKDTTFYKIIDKSNLKIQLKDEKAYKIEANIYKTDGTFIKKTIGDLTGEKREFVFYGDYNDAEIDKLIENQIKRLKYTGFVKGSTFATFGKPDINLLDIISFDGIGNVQFTNTVLNNNEIVNKSILGKGSYLCESIKIVFGINGFRQNIGISNKISITADQDSIVGKLTNNENVFNIEDLAATTNKNISGQATTQAILTDTLVEESKEEISEFDVFDIRRALLTYRNYLSDYKRFYTTQRSKESKFIEKFGDDFKNRFVEELEDGIEYVISTDTSSSFIGGLFTVTPDDEDVRDLEFLNTRVSFESQDWDSLSSGITVLINMYDTALESERSRLTSEEIEEIEELKTKDNIKDEYVEETETVQKRYWLQNK